MDNVHTGMLSASLAKHQHGTTFGQESYSMQALTPRSAASKSKGKSNVSGHPSDHIVSSLRSNRDYIYIPDEHGRIVRRPLSDVESSPSTQPLTQLSLLASSSSSTRSPPRPPPPPEELRPDLRLFRPKSLCGNSSTAKRCENQDRRPESDESQKGIVRQTRQWRVSFDDCHAV